MIFVEYESCFHKFDKHATSILDTEYKRVYFFVRGFRFPLHMSTQSFVDIERTFVEVLD